LGDTRSVLAREDAERTDESDGYVFTSVNGSKLDGSFPSKAFKGYVRLAKLPETIRFHSLRHT
jgi:integrase